MERPRHGSAGLRHSRDRPDPETREVRRSDGTPVREEQSRLLVGTIRRRSRSVDVPKPFSRTWVIASSPRMAAINVRISCISVCISARISARNSSRMAKIVASVFALIASTTSARFASSPFWFAGSGCSRHLLVPSSRPPWRRCHPVAGTLDPLDSGGRCLGFAEAGESDGSDSLGAAPVR